ncbi:hypothetical protein N7448_007949 [Penicillium atrosanguineum]|uniref:Uncharacterized protein n=1 Tax=Penicillium atrosanguineum TaxID=1132637 RepID=A0A9W9UCC4_9EURO|nr:uncharacterized protein N7443_001029 [Penicillium atrosanguineum]KAJ5127170.1 hypothetical protein N7448_007949 [Penicillium atrosanguineum]KAJ5147376.1 hypothetical protein N7526_000728 [Penicillium atrosanguineum]KAJ5314145.1 hypothetical protein N7443_001029 [Penicillium atrosanguineum]KAJ5331311.1 hypothetical protein N7476_001094 [Penicillium atrosanguineum]
MDDKLLNDSMYYCRKAIDLGSVQEKLKPVLSKLVPCNRQGDLSLCTDELLRDDTSNLIDYVQERPVTIFKFAIFPSDTIIVTKEGVDLLDLHRRYTKKRRRMVQIEQVLEWLWDAIAEPILQHLEFLKSLLERGELPRSWWITTSRIVALYLYAAGA